MDAAVARCEVTDTEVDGLPGVAVAGELDAASCRKLAAALARASRLGVPVVLDLDACTFIDSSAVATIMRAVRRPRREGGGWSSATPTGSSGSSSRPADFSRHLGCAVGSGRAPP